MPISENFNLLKRSLTVFQQLSKDGSLSGLPISEYFILLKRSLTVYQANLKTHFILCNMDTLPSKVLEHVVFFNVIEGTPPEQTNAWISALQGLNSLDQVLQLTAGPALRFSSGTYKYTHALHSRYKDKQSLAEYSNHPDHVHVVKDLGLPIVDDVFGMDWEADLSGFAMPSYRAIRVAVFKPKEGLAEQQRAELVEIFSGYKDMFSSVMQVSFGENFSPARAKGFTWGFLLLFPGVKELEELNTNEEHVKIQNEKVLPLMENFMVLEYIISPNSANE